MNYTSPSVPLPSTAPHIEKVSIWTQDGVDLIRVEGDRIVEVSLFSADQITEDAFWAPADDRGQQLHACPVGLC